MLNNWINHARQADRTTTRLVIGVGAWLRMRWLMADKLTIAGLATLLVIALASLTIQAAARPATRPAVIIIIATPRPTRASASGLAHKVSEPASGAAMAPTATVAPTTTPIIVYVDHIIEVPAPTTPTTPLAQSNPDAQPSSCAESIVDGSRPAGCHAAWLTPGPSVILRDGTSYSCQPFDTDPAYGHPECLEVRK